MNRENPAPREFAAKSYQLHAEHYSSYAKDGGKAETAKAWLRQDTINTWRFERMYSCADPLLETYPAASWLTVGDGRYGLDAMYLRSRGAKTLATDISGILLEEAKAQGLIEDYRVENAENLSFASESFDFVFCKESYHHFPRPMCALHEMLRVARHAVLLIEPNDQACPRGFWGTMSRIAKDAIHRLRDRPTHHHQFEEVGNYVYTISRREMEKVALGMGLRTVAFKGVNDYYLPGVEFEPAIPESALFRKVSRKIARYDFLCRWHVSQPGLMAAVIFKRQPSPQARRALEERGYDLVDLPENPWIVKPRTGG